MVIFGKRLCKFYSILGRKSTKNDQSVEPKILKFMIERWGSICADSVRYTQLVVTDTGDVINTLSVVVILLIQLRASQTAPLVERRDVSFILTIFPQNFWNK